MREETVSFRRYLTEELPKDIKTLLAASERFGEELPDQKIFCCFPDSVKVNVLFNFLDKNGKVMGPKGSEAIPTKDIHTIGFMEKIKTHVDEEVFINGNNVSQYKHSWVAGVKVCINLPISEVFSIDKIRGAVISGFDITTPGPERHIIKSVRFDLVEVRASRNDVVNMTVPILTTDGTTIIDGLSPTSDLYEAMKKLNTV